MPTSWESVHAQCPFYKYDDGKKGITCEGCTEGCITRTLFTTAEGRKAHMKAFCCRRYKDCPIFQMVGRKYEK